jgi:hypothetical protein
LKRGVEGSAHQQSRGGRIGASMQMTTTMLLADLPRQEIEGQRIVDRP